MNPTPTNAEIARKLKDIRALMEFAGEPFYKFMAYERAAETIENAGPAAELAASGELQRLPGIGKTLAGRIGEILATGTSAYYEELATRYPPTLLEVLGVQGIGMKTAQASNNAGLCNSCTRDEMPSEDRLRLEDGMVKRSG